jgi:two-component system chemotaxis response regulator CheY
MKPFRILLVDDSAPFRRQVGGALEASGLVVVEATEGFEAMWRARADATFDLVLLDIHMPSLDGLTFMRELRKLPGYGAVPIIVVTSDGSRERRLAGRAAGATAWLLKPPDLPGLINAVHAALMRGIKPAEADSQRPRSAPHGSASGLRSTPPSRNPLELRSTPASRSGIRSRSSLPARSVSEVRSSPPPRSLPDPRSELASSRPRQRPEASAASERPVTLVPAQRSVTIPAPSGRRSLALESARRSVAPESTLRSLAPESPRRSLAPESSRAAGVTPSAAPPSTAPQQRKSSVPERPLSERAPPVDVGD